MSHVIAVLEQADDRKVLEAAEALASLLGVETRRLRVHNGGRQAAVREVLTAIAHDDVRAAVLDAQIEDSVCWDVMQRASKPLLVLPRHCDRITNRISGILVPLDGTQETASCVAQMTERALSAGVRVVGMHVFDTTTVPAFWDQAAHSHACWTEEFRHKNLPVGVVLDLCRGHTPDEVLTEALRTDVDVIMIGWSQNLGEGRAPTVRRTLMEGVLPVLLVSTSPKPSVVRRQASRKDLPG